MRHLMALAAALCAAGAVRQGIQGHLGVMAACIIMCLVCYGWSVALYVAAGSTVVDQILDGKDPRTEDRRPKR